MANPTRSKRSYWPCPVYVAQFSDGTECRMSVWSQEGKPLDFARGRKICCGVIGRERGEASDPLGNRSDLIRYYAPATDLVSGHFEHDGQRIPDPFLSGEDAAPKRRQSTIDRLIASIRKLSAEDLLRLTDEIELAFETAE